MLRLLAQREQGYEDIALLSGIGVDQVRSRVQGALDALDSGLSEDQSAMLRLLAQREEGYADIAALSGGDVESVRDRVRSALAELGTEPKPAPVAPAPTPPPPSEEEPAAVEKPAAAGKPDSATEPAPKPPAKPAPAAKRTRPAAPTAPRLKLPEDRGARRALLAGGAVVLVIVLLLVTGVLGGGGDSSSGAGSGSGGGAGAPEGGTPTANGGKRPTQAVLKPVDGSDASGRALFGREGKNVVLLLGAKGLSPAPRGQSYTISLSRSASERLPLVATTTTKGGVISGRFQIAPQVLGLLASGFDTMQLSVVPDAELRAALKQARTAKKAPRYGGTEILEGKVGGPIVEAGEG